LEVGATVSVVGWVNSIPIHQYRLFAKALRAGESRDPGGVRTYQDKIRSYVPVWLRKAPISATDPVLGRRVRLAWTHGTRGEGLAPTKFAPQVPVPAFMVPPWASKPYNEPEPEGGPYRPALMPYFGINRKPRISGFLNKKLHEPQTRAVPWRSGQRHAYTDFPPDYLPPRTPFGAPRNTFAFRGAFGDFSG